MLIVSFVFTSHIILLFFVLVSYHFKNTIIVITMNILSIINAPGQLKQQLVVNKRKAGNAGEGRQNGHHKTYSQEYISCIRCFNLTFASLFV